MRLAKIAQCGRQPPLIADLFVQAQRALPVRQRLVPVAFAAAPRKVTQIDRRQRDAALGANALVEFERLLVELARILDVALKVEHGAQIERDGG